MSKSTIVALILAATTAIPAASATLSQDPPPRDLNPIGRTFVEFSDWTRITQEEGDVLAESGRYHADTRVWERCATNDDRIVCPGGYVTRWER